MDDIGRGMSLNIHTVNCDCGKPNKQAVILAIQQTTLFLLFCCLHVFAQFGQKEKKMQFIAAVLLRLDVQQYFCIVPSCKRTYTSVLYLQVNLTNGNLASSFCTYGLLCNEIGRGLTTRFSKVRLNLFLYLLCRILGLNSSMLQNIFIRMRFYLLRLHIQGVPAQYEFWDLGKIVLVKFVLVGTTYTVVK